MFGASISINDGQQFEVYADVITVCKHFKLKPVSIDMEKVQGQIQRMIVAFSSIEELDLFQLGLTNLSDQENIKQ